MKEKFYDRLEKELATCPVAVVKELLTNDAKLSKIKDAINEQDYKQVNRIIAGECVYTCAHRVMLYIEAAKRMITKLNIRIANTSDTLEKTQWTWLREKLDVQMRTLQRVREKNPKKKILVKNDYFGITEESGCSGDISEIIAKFVSSINHELQNLKIKELNKNRTRQWWADSLEDAIGYYVPDYSNRGNFVKRWINLQRRLSKYNKYQARCERMGEIFAPSDIDTQSASALKDYVEAQCNRCNETNDFFFIFQRGLFELLQTPKFRIVFQKEIHSPCDSAQCPYFACGTSGSPACDKFRSRNNPNVFRNRLRAAVQVSFQILTSLHEKLKKHSTSYIMKDGSVERLWNAFSEFDFDTNKRFKQDLSGLFLFEDSNAPDTKDFISAIAASNLQSLRKCRNTLLFLTDVLGYSKTLSQKNLEKLVKNESFWNKATPFGELVNALMTFRSVVCSDRDALGTCEKQVPIIVNRGLQNVSLSSATGTKQRTETCPPMYEPNQKDIMLSKSKKNTVKFTSGCCASQQYLHLFGKIFASAKRCNNQHISDLLTMSLEEADLSSSMAMTGIVHRLQRGMATGLSWLKGHFSGKSMDHYSRDRLGVGFTVYFLKTLYKNRISKLRNIWRETKYMSNKEVVQTTVQTRIRKNVEPDDPVELLVANLKKDDDNYLDDSMSFSSDDVKKGRVRNFLSKVLFPTLESQFVVAGATAEEGGKLGTGLLASHITQVVYDTLFEKVFEVMSKTNKAFYNKYYSQKYSTYEQEARKAWKSKNTLEGRSVVNCGDYVNDRVKQNLTREGDLYKYIQVYSHILEEQIEKVFSKATTGNIYADGLSISEKLRKYLLENATWLGRIPELGLSITDYVKLPGPVETMLRVMGDLLGAFIWRILIFELTTLKEFMQRVVRNLFFRSVGEEVMSDYLQFIMIPGQMRRLQCTNRFSSIKNILSKRGDATAQDTNLKREIIKKWKAEDPMLSSIDYHFVRAAQISKNATDVGETSTRTDVSAFSRLTVILRAYKAVREDLDEDDINVMRIAEKMRSPKVEKIMSAIKGREKREHANVFFEKYMLLALVQFQNQQMKDVWKAAQITQKIVNLGGNSQEDKLLVEELARLPNEEAPRVDTSQVSFDQTEIDFAKTFAQSERDGFVREYLSD